MPVYLPNDPTLKILLETAAPRLVVCYCAAWCDTCKQYLPKLEELAQSMPDTVFVWVDIEEYPELLDDEDVENFPTILIERAGQAIFFGTMLPHISQLERMIVALRDNTSTCNGPAPENVQQLLLDALG